ncbi:MAG: response regulator, partial [Cyanobacteria bacterium]|nr:response regulator [Cyanobacteriota bacterium]MDW8199666.1 response regulator [Cyanobacteriota bacterium SKYGB_h_bin112]
MDQLRNPSILVVDDEPDNFDVIETLLSVDAALPGRAPAWDLHYAASGQEAIEAMDTFNPDLILLDVMMPDMNGLEVCQRLKAMPKWQAVPIIMVTALNTKFDLAQCLHAGADDFIGKPVNALELRARVQAMLRIKQQYDALQTLLKLREDMVHMIVHDLRNPLSNILLGVEILRTIDYPKEKQQQKLGQIHSAAQRLQLLIDDLLKIALIESGELRLNRTEISLRELLQSVVAGFEAIASQKDQTLVTKLPISDRPINVDVVAIHRALDNLLSNAIKFSPRHSQIVVVGKFLDSGAAVIQVIDAGPGVPETLQQKIFEKYEIGTIMPDVTQIGLGLAFCKMVIEAHGGTICVENN